MDWFNALLACNRSVTGVAGPPQAAISTNRFGWKLPSVQELTTLVDRVGGFNVLSPGHPFLDVDLEGDYWTATDTTGADRAYTVAFGGALSPISRPLKTDLARTWCARGGSGRETQ